MVIIKLQTLRKYPTKQVTRTIQQVDECKAFTKHDQLQCYCYGPCINKSAAVTVMPIPNI